MTTVSKWRVVVLEGPKGKEKASHTRDFPTITDAYRYGDLIRKMGTEEWPWTASEPILIHYEKAKR